MCFLLFYGSIICDFLEFPSAKSSKILTAHRILWDTNFVHKKSRVCSVSFIDFCKFMVFYRCEETCPIDFPEKTSSD